YPASLHPSGVCHNVPPRYKNYARYLSAAQPSTRHVSTEIRRTFVRAGPGKYQTASEVAEIARLACPLWEMTSVGSSSASAPARFQTLISARQGRTFLPATGQHRNT